MQNNSGTILATGNGQVLYSFNMYCKQHVKTIRSFYQNVFFSHDTMQSILLLQHLGLEQIKIKADLVDKCWQISFLDWFLRSSKHDDWIRLPQ